MWTQKEVYSWLVAFMALKSEELAVDHSVDCNSLISLAVTKNIPTSGVIQIQKYIIHIIFIHQQILEVYRPFIKYCMSCSQVKHQTHTLLKHDKIHKTFHKNMYNTTTETHNNKFVIAWHKTHKSETDQFNTIDFIVQWQSTNTVIRNPGCYCFPCDFCCCQ